MSKVKTCFGREQKNQRIFSTVQYKFLLCDLWIRLKNPTMYIVLPFTKLRSYVPKQANDENRRSHPLFHHSREIKVKTCLEFRVSKPTLDFRKKIIITTVNSCTYTVCIFNKWKKDPYSNIRTIIISFPFFLWLFFFILPISVHT